jgi:CO dehydrogenase maturation factor
MDMEAGIEHLGRGTAGMVDRFIVVVEPGARSLQTYTRIKSLAADLGVKRVSVVGNKIMNEADKDFISARVPQGDLLGFIRFNAGVIEADKAGEAPLANDEVFADEVMQIKAHLEEITRERTD